MSTPPPATGLSIDAEYNSLRGELAQSRRYVFERPLLIIAAAVGVMTIYTGSFAHAVLPALTAALLLFNLWFTVNRMRSAARIVAYIRLVLEPGSTLPWIGWESSLALYRARKHSAPIAAAAHPVNDEPTDLLMYYGPIFWLHLLLIAVSGAATILLAFATPNSINLGAALVTMIAIGISVFFALRWSPASMHGEIDEKERVWRHVLHDVKARNA